jgi:prephenate dehydratase
MRIGYLGPQGTYTEEALTKIYLPEEHDFVSFTTVSDVIEAVDNSLVDKGIVPIENSIEGSVSETLDHLAFDSGVLIEREVLLPIHHHLIGLKDATVTDIKKIISHPQAYAQCRKSLRKLLRDFEVEPAFSTADAVRTVASLNDRSVAAIGNAFAASIYSLEVLARDISDFEENTTRFIVIGKELQPPTGYDKTSIICFIGDDRPGKLLEILQEFSYRYINLTKITSRPTKKKFGEYLFFIDMEGHIEEDHIKAALNCLQCKLPKVKFLGSYRRSL